MEDENLKGFVDLSFRGPGDGVAGKGPSSERDQAGLPNHIKQNLNIH